MELRGQGHAATREGGGGELHLTGGRDESWGLRHLGMDRGCAAEPLTPTPASLLAETLRHRKSSLLPGRSCLPHVESHRFTENPGPCPVHFRLPVPASKSKVSLHCAEGKAEASKGKGLV